VPSCRLSFASLAAECGCDGHIFGEALPGRWIHVLHSPGQFFEVAELSVAFLTFASRVMDGINRSI